MCILCTPAVISKSVTGFIRGKMCTIRTSAAISKSAFVSPKIREIDYTSKWNREKERLKDIESSKYFSLHRINYYEKPKCERSI